MPKTLKSSWKNTPSLFLKKQKLKLWNNPAQRESLFSNSNAFKSGANQKTMMELLQLNNLEPTEKLNIGSNCLLNALAVSNKIY